MTLPCQSFGLPTNGLEGSRGAHDQIAFMDSEGLAFSSSSGELLLFSCVTLPTLYLYLFPADVAVSRTTLRPTNSVAP